MRGRAAVGSLGLFLACALLVACQSGSSGAGSGQSDSRAGGVASGGSGSAPSLLTNENWDLASQDAERYKGTNVTVVGEVFNVLEDSDGFHRFQIYTNPGAKKGNTHVAVKEGPGVKNGYQVKVVGTLQGVRVSRAVSGRELRIPQVEAQSVEVIGPPSVVTLTPIPSPTVEPTATPVPTPSATPKPATPSATPKAATPSATPRPPQSTPVPSVAPTATTGAAGPTAATGQAPVVVRVDAASAQITHPMAEGQDSGAVGGTYLSSPVSNQGWDGTGTPPATGAAALQVEVPHDGSYSIWSRMWYADSNGNSYWLIVDGGPGIKVGNEDEGYRQWKWVGWRDGTGSKRVSVELTAGTHSIQMVGREAGARVDQVLVTDDPNLIPD